MTTAFSFSATPFLLSGAIALGVSAVTGHAQDRFPAPGQSQQGTVPMQQFQQAPQQSGQYQQQYQQRPQYQQQQRQGQMPPPGGVMANAELQDFGVPPTNQLHVGQMHGPTPTSIPGGRVTTTAELSAALQNNQPMLLFHVLGGQEYLPNAQYAAPASAPGSFNDQTQQQFSQYLNQVTQGRKNAPLVFYCASVQCWMSYNAALRAINSGFSNVMWYRGGLEAWKAAGLPTQPPR